MCVCVCLCVFVCVWCASWEYTRIPLQTKTNLRYIQIFSPYRAVNTVHLVIKTNQLIMYMEIIAVYSEIYIKHINVHVFKVKPRGTIQIISRFKELRICSHLFRALTWKVFR